MAELSLLKILRSIAANTTVHYTFTATADLSAAGNHTVKVWVDLACGHLS